MIRRRQRTMLRRANLVRGSALLSAVLATSAVLAPSVAEAQFSARGRRPAPTSKAEATPGPKAGAAQPERPPAGDSSSRQKQLIDRYRKLIVEKPGEEVPLKRLAQLVRQRDGSLQQLLESVRTQAENSSGTERYGARVAWAGLLLEQGQAQQALSPLQAAAAQLPDRAPAWQLLAAVHRSLGHTTQAAQSLERALPQLVGPDALSALREMRTLRLDARDLDGAKEAHAQLLRRSGDSTYVRGELGRELLARGQTEAAVDVLQANLQAARGDARSRLIALDDLGQALIAAGRGDEAIDVLTEAARLAAGQPGRRHSIDLRLAEAHEARGTLGDYLTELSARATSAPSLALLGKLYEQQGRTEEAIEAYRRALERDSRDVDTRLRLVRLYELTGKLEAATGEVGRLTKTAPRDVQLSSRYMTMLLAQGKRREALREWDRLERSTRSDPEAGLILVDLAEQMAESERASRVLDRLRRAGSTPRFFVELGARYFKRNDKEQALATWEKIKSAHRDRAAGLVLYGEILIDHGFAERGLLAIAEGVELSPEDLNYRKSLGLSYERLASSQNSRAAASYEVKAVETYQSILARDATGSAASFARRHLVRLWHRRGELGRQIARLRSEGGSDAEEVARLRLLAEAERKLGGRRAAIQTWNAVLEERAGDREALTALVALHQGADDHEQAIVALERLVEADPTRARQYLEQMARAARARGEGQRALAYAERAATRSARDPGALSRLAELYLAEGKVDRAEEVLRRALSQDDSLDDSNLLLAELLTQKGRADEAFERLAHVLRTTRSVQARQVAGRRLLSLSHVVHRTDELEETLRKLSISRPQSEEVRTLLLETLSAELAPLELEVRYGAPNQALRARERLEQIAARSRAPLLSALGSEKESERRLALALLGYDDQSTTKSALIAFAESSQSASARQSALLSVRDVTDPELIERLERLALAGGRTSAGSLPSAAMAALFRSPTASTRESLQRIADNTTSDRLRSTALLALTRDERMSRRQRLQRADQARALVESRGAPSSARKAALLAWGGLVGRLGTDATEAVHPSADVLGPEAPAELRLAHLAAVSLTQRPSAEGSLPESAVPIVVAGLLDGSAEVRHAALLCAAGISPKLEVSRRQAATLEELVASQLTDWLDEEVDDERRDAVREVLREALLESSHAALLASPRGARTVLDRLGRDELLHPWRSEFLPTLERLAQQDSPVRSQALSLLRPLDGPGVERLLRRALLEPTLAEPTASDGARSPFDAVLDALAEAPTSSDVTLVRSVEEEIVAGDSTAALDDWYAAYRIVEFYRASLLRGDEAAQRLARSGLERLSRHRSGLVSSAARAALAPETLGP